MMSAKDLEEAGHACVALHKFYMDSWKDNETMGLDTIPEHHSDKQERESQICHQQASGETCGFYVAHHIILTATKVGLTRPEDFKIPTGPIPVEELGKIRAKTATFLMSQPNWM
ncbi:hypothetical protein EJB05_50173, partial [Eragrostis curvula]